MTDTTMTRHYGKYRGTVSNNIDPKQLGRLQVSVPAVYGTNTLNWAMPCVPYAGKDVGIFFIPAPGTNIWVEFEGGDLDSPIWSGCFWGQGDAPSSLPQTKIIKTPAGSLTFDETNPAAPIVLKTTAGDKLTLTATGVTLETASGGKIEMSGPSVNVNSGALEIT